MVSTVTENQPRQQVFYNGNLVTSEPGSISDMFHRVYSDPAVAGALSLGSPTVQQFSSEPLFPLYKAPAVEPVQVMKTAPQAVAPQTFGEGSDFSNAAPSDLDDPGGHATTDFDSTGAPVTAADHLAANFNPATAAISLPLGIAQAIAGAISDHANEPDSGGFGPHGFNGHSSTAMNNAAAQADAQAAENDAQYGGQTGGSAGHATQSGAAGDGTRGGDSGGADGGGDDSVICTELHRQGLIDDDMFAGDQKYGRHLIRTDLQVMVGYHRWGEPTVKIMQRSRLFALIVLAVAYPIIKELSARGGGSLFGSLVGKAVLSVGIPFCRWLGRDRRSVVAV